MPAQRAAVPFSDADSQRFRVIGTPLTQQFANLYFTRLGELRPSVEKSIRQKWGAQALQQCVKTLDAEPNVPVVVIGTVYKEMKRKPNILEEVTRDVLEARDTSAAESSKYCGPDDSLMLEDESGRLVLVGSPLEGSSLVTGLVLAVSGCVNASGELEVVDICAPGLAPQRPLGGADEPGDRFVALVSGLHIGDPVKDLLPLQMLLEHLTGQLGCDEVKRGPVSILSTSMSCGELLCSNFCRRHSPCIGSEATGQHRAPHHRRQCHQQPSRQERGDGKPRGSRRDEEARSC